MIVREFQFGESLCRTSADADTRENEARKKITVLFFSALARCFAASALI